MRHGGRRAGGIEGALRSGALVGLGSGPMMYVPGMYEVPMGYVSGVYDEPRVYVPGRFDAPKGYVPGVYGVPKGCVLGAPDVPRSMTHQGWVTYHGCMIYQRGCIRCV